MDYNIALPQFNAPAAQVGGPVNMLTDVLKLKGLQQDQQLNQMKMQEYQRARGDAATKRAEDAKTKAELARIYGAGVNNLAPAAAAAPTEAPMPQMGFGADAGKYTSVPAPAAAPVAAPAPGTPNYAGIITELVRGGHIEEAKKMQDLAKSHTETRGKDYENNVKQIDAAYAPLQALTNRVQSPADVAAYTQMLYNDPVLGPQAAKIKPLEQAIADSQREFVANPKQWQLSHSKVDGKVIYEAATKAEADKKAATAPKMVARDVGGSIKYIDENPDSPTAGQSLYDIQKTLTPAEKAKGPPSGVKPKPGEVWNEETQRMDAVPGSDLFIAQSQKHAKDVRALSTTTSKSDEAVANINKMLDPKNDEGFKANFGGVGTTVTSRMSGKAADFKGLLNTFKSNMKSAGLELMRDRGSIGSMTEKEWPIVEAEMASLDGWMTEENARNVMQSVAARVERIKDKAKEIYDDTWSQTQYHPSRKNPSGAATTPGNPDEPNKPPLGSFYRN
jgi:hypothetical protein